VDLNGHETGNGGDSQRKPTACPDLLYSESNYESFHNVLEIVLFFLNGLGSGGRLTGGERLACQHLTSDA